MCKGRFVFLYVAQFFKGVRRIVTYDSMHCSDEKKKYTVGTSVQFLISSSLVLSHFKNVFGSSATVNPLDKAFDTQGVISSICVE